MKLFLQQLIALHPLQVHQQICALDKKRVNVAHEVCKDQNIKLVQPEVSQNVKQRALRLASRYVSFRISKKPQDMADVVLQAQKQLLLTNSDQPLSPKQKWQRAVLLSANKTKIMKNPSETSLGSSYSEMGLSMCIMSLYYIIIM